MCLVAKQEILWIDWDDFIYILPVIQVDDKSQSRIEYTVV